MELTISDVQTRTGLSPRTLRYWEELGLLPGTAVRLVRRTDLGDLVELEVRGCHLSLRRSEAAELMVEPT